MADVIYGFTSEAVETLRVAGPVVRGIVLDNGIVLAPTATQREGGFEAWVIAKWLREIRSEGFKRTAEYEYLRAQWEREG